MIYDPDHYKILGVAYDSDDVVIQAAYKALMRKYHPDTNTDSDANMRAQAFNAAFAVLGDPARRAAYDASRATHGNAASPPPQGDPPPPPAPPRAVPKPFGFPMRLPANKAPWIIAVVVVLVLIVATSGSQRPYRASNDATDVPATAAITTAASAPPLPGVPNASPSLAGQDGNFLQAVPAPSSLPFAASPVDFDDISGAAVKFDEVLEKRGIIGARAFSKSCHKSLEANPTWSAADRCTAFDIGAAHFDAEVAKTANGAIPQDKYFRFKDDNARDTYTQLGAYPYSVTDRIDNIRRSIGPVVDDVVTARINHEQSARNPSAVEGALSGNGVASANQK